MDDKTIISNIEARKLAEEVASLAEDELGKLPPAQRQRAVGELIKRLRKAKELELICLVCGKPCFDQYMVKDEIWKAAGFDKGYAHLSCLEVRLGRRLRRGDFANAPVNDGIRFGFSRALPEPMTDAEARRFGRAPVPYGEFRGRPADEVPMDRLDWYADQRWTDDLRRYLASRRIRDEKRADEDEGGWDG